MSALSSLLSRSSSLFGGGPAYYPDGPTLPPGCPWSELSRRFPPNVKWCEAPLCSVVVAPADSWSNLAFIAVGLWLLRSTDASSPLRDQRSFGWAAILVGLTSFAYHASANFLSQFGDFLGMYVFILLLISRNGCRLGLYSPAQLTTVSRWGVALCMLCTLGFRLLGLPIQTIVGALILLILTSEWCIWRIQNSRRAKEAAGPDRRFFFLSLSCLAVAAACSALDVTHALCDPDNHVLQGHAAWHVLSALSLLFAARFYSQFVFSSSNSTSTPY